MQTNEKKQKRLPFTTEALREKGFILQPEGTWSKPLAAMGRLATGEHAQQAGALDGEAQASRSRKAGSEARNTRNPATRRAGRSRRKRPHTMIVTMTAYLSRYYDDDNLAGALKPLRDEIADWLGVDDGDRRVLWEVDQTLTRGRPGVCVAIREAIG